MSPPIRRSPLVCCSSPQMMRRKVVLPQPEGPSKTMNSPLGTSKLMPLMAGTSPNFLPMLLIDTAAIDPPSYSIISLRAASPMAERGLRITPFTENRERRQVRTAHERARSGIVRSGLSGPLLHDDVALL